MHLNYRSSSSVTLLAVLGLASVAFAHGIDHTDMNTSNITSSTTELRSYFLYNQHTAWMIAHILVMGAAWVFMLPVTVVLSISQSRYCRPLRFLFLFCNGIGLVLALIYNAKTPDLYQNNAHHRFGWFMTWFTLGQAVLGSIPRKWKPQESHNFTPVSQGALYEHQRHNDPSMDSCQLTHDSGHGTESTESRSPSFSEEIQILSRQRNMGQEADEDYTSLHGGMVGRLVSRRISTIQCSRILRTIDFVYNAADRVVLLLGFAVICTGWITYGGLFRGTDVFSGLAHFIKGGVFFWIGILTLGRWAGCFADLGWAWNVKRKKGNFPSAEFVESFLIFFYGITNVFLEHLAAWGAEWSAKDLEHVSLTVIFFGGGLCGMLIESTSLRNLINTNQEPLAMQFHEADEKAMEPPSYMFSMNPFPALVIIILGMMMSSHHQESMISTTLHSLWGNLLMSAAFSRVGTYLLFYLSPPRSVLPGRPPTELLSAFCLMAGGLIFMSSAGDVTTAVEFYKLDAMFVFAVTAGVVTVLMAWAIVVMTIKGWPIRENNWTSDHTLLA